MKITIFTSNNLRHNYLINTFSKHFKEIYVFQETRSLFPGQYNSHYDKSKFIKKYFDKVQKSQLKFFGNKNFYVNSKKVNIVPLSYGDLNLISIEKYPEFFKSNNYIVFGSSYIKEKLFKFLKKNKAINIHMGLSPYYRGTDCNFWALYDGNFDKVGATIHLLSSKLDGGKIIEYAYPNKKYKNPFDYSMSVTKNVVEKLIKVLKKKEIKFWQLKKQNKKYEVRYSTKKEFSEATVKKFFNKLRFK